MSKLKIAIQKSGRLNEDSMKILKDVGVAIDNGKDQLKASAKNFPLEVFYLRNGDIPQYLKDGVVIDARYDPVDKSQRQNDATITMKIIGGLGFKTGKSVLASELK